MPTDLTKSIGAISPPPGVDKQIQASGLDPTKNEIAIFWFVSNLMRVALAFLGIWVLFNFILAGYIYITGKGDTKSHELVKAKITMSVIGLALIIGAYVITAVLSYLLWGDPGFVLKPEISGP